jgi:predicted nuclease of predicted toxin-antitoxin system
VTELFGRLYLDENVPVILAGMIRLRGFFATTARDEGLLGIDDDAIHLNYATSHGLCLVTHNRQDFINLHENTILCGENHAGIIIATVQNLRILAERLVNRLNTHTADELANNLFLFRIRGSIQTLRNQFLPWPDMISTPCFHGLAVPMRLELPPHPASAFK